MIPPVRVNRPSARLIVPSCVVFALASGCASIQLYPEDPVEVRADARGPIAGFVNGIHRQLSGRDGEPSPVDMRRGLCGMPRFAHEAATAYARHDNRPVFVRHGDLTADGRVAVELIRDVASHGLNPSDYPLPRLEAALSSLRAARLPYATEGVVQESLLEPLRRAMVDVEVILAGGFLQYALDFRHLRRADPSSTHGPAELAQAARLFSEPLTNALAAAVEDGEPGASMRSWWPSHPHYGLTRKALKRYRALVASGVPSWEQRRRRVRPEAQGEHIAQLRQRLAVEGYESGAADDQRYDDALARAIAAFQKDRQLEPTGVIGRGAPWKPAATTRELQVPMEQRARTLELALQRWRESAVGTDSYFVRVNIPSYEVQVWDRGAMVRRHRAVVGFTGKRIDQRTGHPTGVNRTPIMSSRIDRLVLNPVWFVPVRIQHGELKKDDSWLKRRGFRSRKTGDGQTRLFQLPGRGNALGKVKLLFPNRHSVYLHDTPLKWMFDKTIRSYSHGCIRVDQPLGLVDFLAQRDGALAEGEMETILAERKTREVPLTTAVPIHIEYNTVHFQPDSERPVFLRDVYGFDTAYFNGELPYTMRDRRRAARRAAKLAQVSRPAGCSQADAGPR